jgi:iron complex transport system substrate-binding protein
MSGSRKGSPPVTKISLTPSSAASVAIRRTRSRPSPRRDALGGEQAGHVHFVPDLPFSWLDNPPAPNRLIGLLWL